MMEYDCDTCSYKDNPPYTGKEVPIPPCATCSITFTEPGNWTPEGCAEIKTEELV